MDTLDDTKSITLSLPAGEISGFGPDPIVAASLFLPASIDADVPCTIALCLHGGGYSRTYFDIAVPDRSGYSMARHLAGRGIMTVTIDALGTADSSAAKDPDAITWQNLAQAHHTAFNFLLADLRRGALMPDLPPLRRIATVGIGHSLGGMSLTAQQATHGTFDRLAVLGWSNLGLNLPPEATKPIVDASGRYFRSSPALRREFHLPDVPPDVLACPAERENQPVAAALAAQASDRSAIRSLAERIETPILVAFGERDTARDPEAEPAVYVRSRAVTFYRLAGSAHCHNFATTRQALWNCIADWALAG
jgi:hypothetical protein